MDARIVSICVDTSLRGRAAWTVLGWGFAKHPGLYTRAERCSQAEETQSESVRRYHEVDGQAVGGDGSRRRADGRGRARGQHQVRRRGLQRYQPGRHPQGVPKAGQDERSRRAGQDERQPLQDVMFGGRGSDNMFGSFGRTSCSGGRGQRHPLRRRGPGQARRRHPARVPTTASEDRRPATIAYSPRTTAETASIAARAGTRRSSTWSRTCRERPSSSSSAPRAAKR